MFCFVNIEPILKWMEKAVVGLVHGNVTVSINIAGGKMVFVRKRREETEKSIDAEDEEEYDIDQQ